MSPHGDNARPLESMAIAITLMVTGLSTALWVAAQVAGRVFGGGAPALRPADLPGVLLRLPSNLRDPGAAFPSAARAELPGPVGFHASLLATVLCFSLGGLAAHRLLRSRATERGAALATSKDLAGLLSREPIPGRLTLGRLDRRLVVAEPRHSLLVIGPPQTGKTSALAIPAILEWPGPVLVTSSKTDVHEVTQDARAQRGEVMLYDPTGEPERSIGWTPLTCVKDWATAQAAARALMSAGGPVEGMNESGFWQSSAEMLLAPLLLAATGTEGMAKVIRWLDQGPDADREIHATLERIDDGLATSAWLGVQTLEPRTRSIVGATARTVLSAWWDPGVLTSGRDELTPGKLLAGANSLFLVSPAHDQERLRSVFAGIVSQMTRAVYDHRARTGRRLDPGLLVVLDEAAHIAPVSNLAELAATGPEPGIQLVSVFHDTAQISSTYGNRAPSVIANHRARIYLPGIGDPETLDRVSRSLGETRTQREQSTRSAHGDSVTTQEVERSLLPAHELREMSEHEALLVYGARPPARIHLRPWFRDRVLKRVLAEALPAPPIAVADGDDIRPSEAA